MNSLFNKLFSKKNNLKDIYQNYHNNYIEHEKVPKIFLISQFECHQIWQNVLKNDCHLNNIAKLKKKIHQL